LPPVRRGWRESALLGGYGALAALLFGVAMNLSFWPFTLGVGSELSYVAGAPVAENLERFVEFIAASSLGWDVDMPRADTCGRRALARLGRGPGRDDRAGDRRRRAGRAAAAAPRRHSRAVHLRLGLNPRRPRTRFPPTSAHRIGLNPRLPSTRLQPRLSRVGPASCRDVGARVG